MPRPGPLSRLLPLLAVAAAAATGDRGIPDPPLADGGWSEEDAGVGRLRMQPAATEPRMSPNSECAAPHCDTGAGAVVQAASSGSGELSVDDSSMKLLIQLVHNPTQWERLKQTLNRIPYTAALAGLVAHSRFSAAATTPAPAGRYLRWRPDPAAAARRLVFRRGRWPTGDGHHSRAVVLVSRAAAEASRAAGQRPDHTQS
ncbi:uncharacterized protein LOC122369622 [Amphibalanus amphitrite]|uniref:uncharacterized protein LOC122369622 n=1 Tax=Amphibalanus amphitrite TaxID=1232801 RepID=UPI001C8FA882|nr:uncharacterized protein LOC122369622 [Amphibalanus amphitrite]